MLNHAYYFLGKQNFSQQNLMKVEKKTVYRILLQESDMTFEKKYFYKMYITKLSKLEK